VDARRDGCAYVSGPRSVSGESKRGPRRSRLHPRRDLNAVTSVLNFNRRIYSVMPEPSPFAQQLDLNVKGPNRD